MRRKLTTPDTWNIIAAAILIALLVGGGIWYFEGQTSSQEAFVVRASGKVLITPAEWATAQATNAKFARSPGHDSTIDAMVNDRLEYDEAVKRGTVCTTAEATAKMNDGIGPILAANDENATKDLTLTLEVSGHVPDGYSLTPVAEQTPALAVAVATYEADPTTIDVYRRGCSVGKLFDSLAPDGDNAKRSAGISALRSQLRNDAGLEYGSAATPTAQ